MKNGRVSVKVKNTGNRARSAPEVRRTKPQVPKESKQPLPADDFQAGSGHTRQQSLSLEGAKQQAAESISETLSEAEDWTPPFKNWTTWKQASSCLSETLDRETVQSLKDTYEFAAERHTGQTRPDGEAYSIHLLEVVDILHNGAGVKEKSSLQAALLHDVVEDTPTSLAEVEMRYGPETARKVGWLTKPEVKSGESKEQVRADYLADFKNAPDDVLQVKLADRLSNVQRLNTHPRPAKQRSYFKETVENIVPLAENQPWFKEQFGKWQSAFSYLGA